MIMDLVLKSLENVSQQMENLDHNMTRLHFINESLSNFNESNGALVYGLMCNTWSIELQSNQFNVDAVQRELDNIEKIEEIENNIKNVQLQIEKLTTPLPKTDSALHTLPGKPGSSRKPANTSQSNAGRKRGEPTTSSSRPTHSLSNGSHRHIVTARASNNDTTSSFVTNPDASTIQPLKNYGSARHNMPNRAQPTPKSTADRVYKNRRKSSILNSAREKSIFQTPENHHTERYSLAVGPTRLGTMGLPQQRTSLAGPAHQSRETNASKNGRAQRYTTSGTEFRSARSLSK